MTSPVTVRDGVGKGRGWIARSTTVLLSLTLAACSSLAGPFNALFIPDDGYRLDSGISFGESDRQRLDVYVPTGAAEPRDVVVFFYGGSWKSGSRADYRFVGEAFTRHGFVTVIPDYRLYPEVQFPAFVRDGAAAVAWVEANIAAFGGAPDRIFLVGHSAGAHIAAMLGVAPRFLDEAGADPAAIRGFVGLAGPYAFDPDRYGSIRAVFQDPDVDAAPQPVAYVDGDEPPMLLLHGTDDKTVNASNMFALAHDVTRTGGRAKPIEIEDTDHIGLILALAHPFREPGGVLDTIVGWMRDVVNSPHDGMPDAAAQACNPAQGA